MELLNKLIECAAKYYDRNETEVKLIYTKVSDHYSLRILILNENLSNDSSISNWSEIHSVIDATEKNIRWLAAKYDYENGGK